MLERKGEVHANKDVYNFALVIEILMQKWFFDQHAEKPEPASTSRAQVPTTTTKGKLQVQAKGTQQFLNKDEGMKSLPCQEYPL